MSRIGLLSLLALVAVVPLTPAGDDVPPAKQYQAFMQKQAAELRKNDKAPATVEEWTKQEAELRKNLFAAWGGEACFLPKPCDLDPKQHGELLKRDGYTVEKITIQTRPGVRMTANLYIPDGAKKKPAPAILMVHGHWRGAKQDPVVQSRCIGAAKLGFVVLCVDAFGAGERGVGTALGEYHGEMTAATLLPVGLPLSGLQVYENTRAVDYLETRPEVDKTKIGITGGQPRSRDLRVAARLQHGDARDDVRVHDAAPQGRRQGRPDPGAGVQDGEPGNAAVLPRRHPPEGLHDDPEVRGTGGEETARRAATVADSRCTDQVAGRDGEAE
jgi:hypothetical protein